MMSGKMMKYLSTSNGWPGASRKSAVVGCKSQRAQRDIDPALARLRFSELESTHRRLMAAPRCRRHHLHVRAKQGKAIKSVFSQTTCRGPIHPAFINLASFRILLMSPRPRFRRDRVRHSWLPGKKSCRSGKGHRRHPRASGRDRRRFRCLLRPCDRRRCFVMSDHQASPGEQHVPHSPGVQVVDRKPKYPCLKRM
jgi:hypothetical protein